MIAFCTLIKVKVKGWQIKYPNQMSVHTNKKTDNPLKLTIQWARRHKMLKTIHFLC